MRKADRQLKKDNYREETNSIPCHYGSHPGSYTSRRGAADEERPADRDAHVLVCFQSEEST